MEIEFDLVNATFLSVCYRKFRMRIVIVNANARFKGFKFQNDGLF